MQNDEKIQSTISFLIILYCIALVFISPSLAYAQKIQELHQLKKSTVPDENAHIVLDVRPEAIGVIRDRIYVTSLSSNSTSVIDAANSTKIADIKVGGGPYAIGVDEVTGTVYVANYYNDTVSMVDGFANIRIGHDIKVGGGPSAIGVNEFTDTVYTANFDNTVSVIDAANSTKIADIPVGGAPSAIGVNKVLGRVYVANSIDNTVSVIDGKMITKITDIPVGNSPSAISVSQATDIIYVANSGSTTLSVIDGNANKLVAGVTFDVKPVDAGHIECYKDRVIAPTVQQFYLWSGSQCTAKPNQGFEFVSWQENLGGNSTQLISVANPPSFLDPILDALHLRPDKPESKINITKFGTFTAN